MTRVPAGGLTLEVQSFGAAGDPPVVLVAGFTQQLTDWDAGLIDGLVGAGFRVVVFDNRDVGASGRASAPYVITDLAADTVAVLDASGIERAHLLGVSMGGMVVQQLAISHPDRVRSLVSVMSTTGARADSVTTPEAAAVLSAGPARTQAELIANQLAFAEVCGSPAYPTPPEVVTGRARLAWARGYDADGIARQFRALFAPGQNRTVALGQLEVPTLVIHGELDPLIGVAGGRATAAAVPGAELWVVPGMGHDLPAQLNDELVGRLVAFWRRPA